METTDAENPLIIAKRTVLGKKLEINGVRLLLTLNDYLSIFNSRST
jgi:hypothetical protein